MEMLGSPEVSLWLAQNLPNRMQEAIINVASNTKLIKRSIQVSSGLDICFYLRLLPACIPPLDLFIQLSSFLQQLMELRMHSQGKAFIGVEVSSIQVMTQIIQTTAQKSSGKSDITKLLGMEAIVSQSISIANIVVIACDIKISPAPFPVMLSTAALLLQLLTSLSNRYDQVPEIKLQIINIFQYQLLPCLSYLPIEVTALLVCATDQIIPDMSRNVTQDFLSLASQITLSGNPIDALLEGNHMNTLSRDCASLDALARHYSIAPPAERQRFIETASPLQV
jgi:hypothetical protein